MKNNTAGDPMGYKGIWTHLKINDIKLKLEEKKITVSKFIVSKLISFNGLSLKKLQKYDTIKEVSGRDEQFKNINKLIEEAKKTGAVILSIDTKKKEALGNLYRNGKVFCTDAMTCYDHDYANLKKGLIAPHGIYDLIRNEGYINLTSSKDTAEFSCDSIEYWFNNYGIKYYGKIKSLLILCDGGGSNSSSHHIFKENLQKLSNKLNLEIRIAHYPPYCSKYNPIEHRMFPHVTRALEGITLDSIQTIKSLIEEKAKTLQGLKVFVNIFDKIYETGKKASKEFLDNYTIKFDENLKKWNYCVLPF
jgi:hypothetical protein